MNRFVSARARGGGPPKAGSTRSPKIALALLGVLALLWFVPVAAQTPAEGSATLAEGEGSAPPSAAAAAEAESADGPSGASPSGASPSGAPPSGDAATPESRGELRDGSGEGAAVEAPEPPEVRRARTRARRVAERARLVVPPLVDPRIDRLRTGAADVETAELLGVTIVDLTDADAVSALRLAAEQAREHAERDAERISADALEAIASANGLFAAYHGSAELSTAQRMVVRAQLSAAWVLARERLAARDAARLERAVQRATLDYLDARAEAIAAAAELQPEVGPDGEQLNDEIASERERLARESEATDEVEQRAAEASERARVERDRARTVMEQDIAARWEALGPRLDRIAHERRLEEERVATQTQRAEEIAAAQIDLGAQLSAVFELVRAEREERADALVDELMGERDAARVRLRDAANERDERRAVVAAARDRVDEARRERDRGGARDVSPELRARLRELQNEALRTEEEAYNLEVLRLRTAEARWRLVEAEINFYSRSVDQLIDALSPERRRELWRINRANVEEAARNLRERGVAFGVIWQDRVERTRNFRREIGWVAALESIAEPLLLLFVYLGLRRSLPRWRPAVVARVYALRESPRFRRAGRAVLKIAEIVHTTMAQWLALAFVALLAIRMPVQVPELGLFIALATWLVGYRLLSRSAGVLFLPRRDRDPITLELGEGTPQRLGVDVFDMPTRRAQLVLRSIRLCLLYFVSGRVGLAAVRALFGPGFVYHYANISFQAGLFVLVYLLCWYWRRPIVELFCASVGPEADRFVAWLREREGRPYIVLIVAALAVYLAGIWVVRTVTAWAAGRGPGQRIANFIFRRRLQRARQTTQAVALATQPLQVAYRRVFRAHALEKEAYRVPRPRAESAFRDALHAWRESRVRGTVAVIGEAGGGKTTLLRSFASEFNDAEESLTYCIPPARVDDDATLFAWLESIIEREPGSDAAGEAPSSDATSDSADCNATDKTAESDEPEATPDAEAATASHDEDTASATGTPEKSFEALVEAFSQGPLRVICIDECERLFLRCVGGFRAVDRFLDLVTLTNHRVMWVLSFDRIAWMLLHRVRERRGYFRETIHLKPWTDGELRELVELRNEATGVHPMFDRLSADGDEQQFYEVVRTSAGYYRLLAEISSGNPRVAQYLWLRSVVRDSEGRVHVTLFERPDDDVLRQLDDELLFALTSLIQHNGLTTREVATTINADPMTCEVYVNHLRELGILERCEDGARGGRRHRVAVDFYHSTLARLRAVNLLHLR